MEKRKVQKTVGVLEVHARDGHQRRMYPAGDPAQISFALSEAKLEADFGKGQSHPFSVYTIEADNRGQ